MALVDSLPDTERVVITGRGAVCAMGLNIPESIAAFERGVTGITTAEAALGYPLNKDVSVGGFVKDFNPDDYIDRIEGSARVHRSAALYYAAATEAELDAGLLKETPPPFKGSAQDFIEDLHSPKWRDKNPDYTPERYGVNEGGYSLLQVLDPHRWGVVPGTGVGGTPYTADMEAIQLYRALQGKGVSEEILDEVFSSFGRKVKDANGKLLRENAGDTLVFLPERVATVKAKKSGYRGPGYIVTAACASALIAMGLSADHIRHDEKIDGMLTGGAEAGNDRIGFQSFNSMTAMSTNSDPLTASRPMDANADGLVMGEGAGALVAESLASAKQRNAYIYAEILGYANNLDAFHDTASRPGGVGAVLVMELALAKAGLSPEEIDYIKTHTTSTLGDKNELDAYKALFGNRISQIPLIGLKSWVGHTMGASGGTEAALTMELMKRGFLPGNLNLEKAIAEGFNIPTQSIYFDGDIIMENSLGFGGINACMIFRRWRGLQPVARLINISRN